MKTWFLPSHGQGHIYCKQWEPEGQPVAILQLVHGIAEHIERYHDFATFMASHGFLVVGEDHMGHGNSAGDDQLVGHFYGGWAAAVDDVEGLRRHMAELYPDFPYIILGHSMGSFLTRTLLFRYKGEGLSGVILSGTGWMSNATLKAGQLLCRLEIKRRSVFGHSPLMQRLMFDGYNLKFAPTRTPYDWISTDTETVDEYVRDPMCGILPTLGLVEALLCGLIINQKMSNLRVMKTTLPTLFLSGGDDPVGDMGIGVKRCHKRFQEVGIAKNVIKLFPGFRHEMLNETCKNDVYAYILAWINENIEMR